MKGLKAKKQPSDIRRFIFADKGLIALIAVTGTLFNVGLIFIPYFEGQLAQCLYDIILKEKVFKDMLILVGVYLAVMLFIQLTRYLKRYYVRKMANNFAMRLRLSYYSDILKKKPSELNESVGEIVTKAVGDIDAVTEGVRKTVTETFDTGVLIIAYAVMMAIYDVRITLLSLAFTPVACLIAELLKKVIHRETTKYKKSFDALNNYTFDRVGNALTYRVNSQDRQKNDEYERLLKDFEKKAVRANVWENCLQPIYNAISMSGVVFIIIFGTKNCLGTGFKLWDIAAFTTFVACFAKVCDKSSKVAKLFNGIQKAQVSWNRIKDNVQFEQAEFTDLKMRSKYEKVRLEVDNLTFSYDGSTPLLNGISLSAESGRIIGVTGQVATGKSTFAKMFLNEYDFGGDIRINGRSIKQMTDKELFDKVSYQGQNNELFSDTLRNNVCFGDDSDVAKYLEMVDFLPDLKGMTDGVESHLGNLGTKLSGGQQQRIALARTLSHAKNIIILDEPFSACDKRTEAKITENLKKNFSDRLIIIVSHRITAFKDFDKVLFLDGDKALYASHQEMLGLSREYARLYAMQTGVTQ
ncbi:MAG: ABC transporter ATP-binding protein [Christensenellaceae bacterium]